jgi:MFS family permease
VAALIVFVIVETRIAEPLFHLSLFRIRPFAAGNVSNLLVALARGGIQFILIIWLQGIWLPLHGYDFSVTPLWAGIYMVPLTIGFLVSAPLSGFISDRIGARYFTTGGALLAAASFVCLFFIPVNFRYPVFALVLVLNGFGSGLFASPNRAEIMNSVPANQRGAAGGMIATFQNTAFVLSIGIFFSLIVTGLASTLPSVMYAGLKAQGIPAAAATHISHLPPISVLFAAFLGYNPVKQLLGPKVLAHLPAGHAAYLTSRSFFPHLVSTPFHDGLSVAFGFAIGANVLAAVAATLTGGRKLRAAQALRLAASDAASVAAPVGEPAPAGDPAPATEAVRPAVRGTVRDAQGAAIPGAVLTLIGGDGWQAGRAETAADGGYGLDGVPLGTFSVIATALGHAPQAAVVKAAAGTVVSHDFVLAGSGGFTGVAPVAEAEVHGVVSGPGDAPAPGVTVSVVNSGGDVVASTVTGEDGTYRLAGLDGGEHVLVASGFNPVSAVVRVEEGQTATVTLDLGPGPG